MNDEIKFKTKFSYSYLIYILVAFFVASQISYFIDKDFFNKTAWLNYGKLMTGAFIFNLFFTSSFEISSDYLKLKLFPLLFFLKPKIYKISDIDYIKIVHLRGNVLIPYISIKLKGKESIKIHYYLSISKNSIEEMFLILKCANINVSYFDKPL